MKLFISILVIVFVSTSYSQIIKNYGIKFGGTFSIQDDVILPGGQITRDDIIGLNIGTFAELFNLPVFSVISEINYVQKGFKGNRSDIYYTNSLSWKERINYLNISVMGKTRIESKIISPYFFLGPRIDIKLNESSNISNSPKYDYKNYLLGLKIGLGTEIKLSIFKILTEFLYDYGFENINEKGNIKYNSLDFRIGLCI